MFRQLMNMIKMSRAESPNTEPSQPQHKSNIDWQPLDVSKLNITSQRLRQIAGVLNRRQHDRVQLRRVFGQRIAHGAGLRRAAGGAGLGVEEDEALTAFERLQTDGVTVLVRRGEGGGQISRFQFFHVLSRLLKKDSRI